MSDKKLKIRALTIDGGGIRGVFSAHLLKRISKEHHIDFCKKFDLVAGTSTGSIIAAGIATGMSLDDIADLYEKVGKKIFKRRFLFRYGFLASRYSKNNLEKILDEVFGERTLSQTETRLIIPATDIGNGGVHVFKSPYSSEFVRDPDVKIKDAILASCSAPTYFDPTLVGEYLLADGGLWANCPSLVAIVDSVRRLGANLSDIKVLAIGAGTGKKYYTLKRSRFGWGFLTRWGRGKFIDTILNLQTEVAMNMATLLLPKENLLRLSFESDSNLTLDNWKEIPDLKSKADKQFSHASQMIKEFLEE